MPRPAIIVTVASTDYRLVCLPLDKEGNHVIQTTRRGFPDAAPPEGRSSEANYLPHQFVSQRPPLGIGLKNVYQAKRIWDMEADARFSAVTLPRLITTTAFPGGTTAVVFKQFAHAIGELFMFGDQTTGEHLLYWDNTNWADSTFDADTAGNRANIRGIADHEGRAYMVSYGGGGSTLSYGTSATVWADATNGAGGTDGFGLVSDGANLYATTGTTSILVRKTADEGGTAWSTIATIGSTGLARGLVLWGDGTSSPALDLIVGTPDALYHVDTSASTFKLLIPFQHPEGAYTGKLLATPHGVVWTDGPNVLLGDWSDGSWTYKGLGPEDIDDGVPLEQKGDVTWIAYDSTLDELAFGKGGLAASRNQVIYFYSFKTGLIAAKMGRNGTANRASFAGVYSSETGGINRLHFSRDNGVANDSDAVYLNYISENPDVQTSATFATSGVTTRSRFNGFAPLFKKGFLKGKYRADDLTADESLSIKYATDGGALGTAQTITSGPVGTLWTDGSTTAVGSDAYDIYDEITLARVAGTNTNTPKIRDMGWAYEVVALKDDNTPLRSLSFRISLDPNDYAEAGDTESAKDVRNRLETILGNRPLVLLSAGQDFPEGSEIKCRMRPYEGRRRLGDTQDQNDLPQDIGGYVDIVLDEVT